MRNLLYILPMVLCLISCEESPENTSIEALIMGEWSALETNDTIYMLEKVSSIPNDEYGIAFLQNGALKEYKIAGWCATPPVAYTEFTGSWELSSDSLLTIESTYWGGEMSMKWKILEVEDDRMSYLTIETYYQNLE